MGRQRAGDLSIQGFATDISVNTGGTIGFKINTPSINYHIDIYRLGYYANGAGGARLRRLALPRRRSPKCSQRVSTIRRRACTTAELAVSATWNTAATPDGLATSGIYVAKLIRDDLSVLRATSSSSCAMMRARPM